MDIRILMSAMECLANKNDFVFLGSFAAEGLSGRYERHFYHDGGGLVVVFSVGDTNNANAAVYNAIYEFDLNSDKGLQSLAKFLYDCKQACLDHENKRADKQNLDYIEAVKTELRKYYNLI